VKSPTCDPVPSAVQTNRPKSTIEDKRKQKHTKLEALGHRKPPPRQLIPQNSYMSTEWLRERTEHLDIFLFPPITQRCSISDVPFTGGRGVSGFKCFL